MRAAIHNQDIRDALRDRAADGAWTHARAGTPICLAVQVDGRVGARIWVSSTDSDEHVQRAAVAAHIAGRDVRRVVRAGGRLLNFRLAS